MSDPSSKKRLAIIGGASSGLISLKYAIDALPDWEIVCFEESDRITGCWGQPPEGFVSTSTKYTTQFACFQQYDARVTPHSDARCHDHPSEFFCDSEYGDYLERFANAFDLHPFIRLMHRVENVYRCVNRRFLLSICHHDQTFEEHFDAVIVCTGLADHPKPLSDESLPVARTVTEASAIQGKGVVVIGGGESAVDIARRLADPQRTNRVYLSLRSGIRVSPRFHPIRGVPSDFLRNRLLLSIHPDLRNWIGQRFVEFRIRHQEWLERLSRRRGKTSSETMTSTRTSQQQTITAARKSWDMKLTRAAKDHLFNMYHNKSDDFLQDVAEGRITIVGENIDDRYQTFFKFDSKEEVTIDRDCIVPAIGYRSTLGELTGDQYTLRDFYHGCCHLRDSVFLVGFTRPIIGNIPSISEMQARYACDLIAGRIDRRSDLAEAHQANREMIAIRFPHLDRESAYPVEMFPYCDELAKELGCFPDRQRAGGWSQWCRMMLAPATTMHYDDPRRVATTSANPPIHVPMTITLLLLAIKPFDAIYRRCRLGRNRPQH